MTALFEQEPHEYLDRQRRMRQLMRLVHGSVPEASGTIDVADFTLKVRRIQQEVPNIPLIEGHRYRWKMLKLTGGMHAHHFLGDEKVVVEMEIPDVEHAEWKEQEGQFIGRQPNPASQTADMLIFVLDQPDEQGNEALGFGEMDILTIEDITPWATR